MRKSTGKIKKPSPNQRESKRVCKRKTDVPVTSPPSSRSWHCPHKSDKIVILDLDHTLVDSDGFKQSTADRRYVIEMGGQKTRGSTRPNLKQFLTFLDQYAEEVVLWTAGTREYAEAIADIIYDGMKKPKRIMHREDCAYEPTSDGVGYYHKPILQVAESMGYDPDAILIVDDMPHTFRDNPKSGLLIKGYYGENDDDHLGMIADWLVQPQVRHSWSIGQLNKDQYSSKQQCPSY